MASNSPHIFGIRHHGPGSARSMLAAFTELRPDVILLEGPPDADALVALAADPEMQPPVALLIYNRDEPRDASFYPFARFSPEWAAMTYGLRHGIPVRFMDLPMWHRLALDRVAREAADQEAEREAEAAAQTDNDATAGDMPESLQALTLTDERAAESIAEQVETSESQVLTVVADMDEETLRADPLLALARAAGYADSERWWDHLVEQRREGGAVFEAIMEGMTALREATAHLEPSSLELRREAWMRKTIREAQKDNFARIAVVCGAWHAPALAALPKAKVDNDLLKGMPKVKTEATWVPWTYGRLASRSGYGAGIESPGWYDHLWTMADGGEVDLGEAEAVGDEGISLARHREHAAQADASRSRAIAVGWLAQVASLMRGQDLEASSAQVIEAVRLAETLAALRGRPAPGLPELNEATLAVLCNGETTPLALIHDRLTVGECLGQVPESTPTTPLRRDLDATCKSLRLKPEATTKPLDLDLRREIDLARSHLLHRLMLLDLPWGRAQQAGNKSGTFHELWQLTWQPEFAVQVIEAGTWGSTVAEAASARTVDRARQAGSRPDGLATLTLLLEQALLAELPTAMPVLMDQLQRQSALASDVGSLMDALPPLASVMRYGSVRQGDTAMVSQYINGLVERICIGLARGCAALDADASGAMLTRINAVQQALILLQDVPHLATWHEAVRGLLDLPTLHGLLRGRACRLLLDAGHLEADDALTRLRLALATAVEPEAAAAWLEGFLQGGAMLLLYDDRLWDALDCWLCDLRPEAFESLLPLIRRTFGTFPAGERQQLGGRVGRTPPPGSSGGAASANSTSAGDDDGEPLDAARAARVLPLLAMLLGPPSPMPPTSQSPIPTTPIPSTETRP